MSVRKTWSLLLIAGLACGGAWLGALGPAGPPASPLVVIDGTGKEQKVKGWTFTQGTRRLTWLAPAAKDDPHKNGDGPRAKGAGRPRPPIGPEALEFREDNSTDFQDGVVTLVLLDHLRAIRYDDKHAVTVSVFLGPKVDEDLTFKGTTKYQGVNKITIEAEVDKGDLGIAELKFLGGVPKGIRGVRFESPKPASHPAGRAASVVVADKAQKAPQPVKELLPLYQAADGREQVVPVLMFKKTLKVDVNKIQKVVAHDSRDPDAVEWTVTLKDGSELTLTLLKTIAHDGKTLTLEGMLGRVTGGYRLFPAHTISEIRFDEKDDKP